MSDRKEARGGDWTYSVSNGVRFRSGAVVDTEEPMRRAAKIDGNHAAIVAGLRSVGASVTPLHAVGNGCPDLLVGFRGVNSVIEVKDGSLAPSERLLTPQQKKWHAEWQGKAHVANSLMEALLIIGARSV